MKNKNIIKIIICLMLSCSLCVSAPLARYQRIESHAAIAVPIAIGAATIAFMFLAACGLNYVFDGMTQSQAETWLNDKMVEFASTSDGNGGTMGSIPLANNWKLTAIGGLAIASTLSNWLGKLATWLKGEQADNSTDVVYEDYSIQSDLPIQFVDLPNVNTSYSGTLNQYYTFDDAVVGQEFVYMTTPYIVKLSCYNKNNTIAYFDLYVNGQQIVHGIEFASLSYDKNSVITRGGSVCINENPEAWCYVAVRYAVNNPTNTSIVRLGNKLLSDLAPVEYNSENVTQKTETVTIPQEIVNNYYYTISPDVQTTSVGEGNIPVPLTSEQIADAVWDKVSANSLADVVYAPTIDLAQEGFAALDDVNSVDYDIPLEEVEQPAWDAMTASDVPAFATSIWNYFLQNHNWSQLKQKFPFSLPYDAYLIANIFFDTSYDVMDELPTAPGNNRRLVKASNAPVYSFAIPKWDGTTYELVLDFSLIDPWQPIIRAAVGVLFTVGLIVGVL